MDKPACLTKRDPRVSCHDTYGKTKKQEKKLIRRRIKCGKRKMCGNWKFGGENLSGTLGEFDAQDKVTVTD